MNAFLPCLDQVVSLIRDIHLFSLVHTDAQVSLDWLSAELGRVCRSLPANETFVPTPPDLSGPLLPLLGLAEMVEVMRIDEFSEEVTGEGKERGLSIQPL